MIHDTLRHPSSCSHNARRALSLVGTVLLAAGCTENLPSGPATFSAAIQIIVPHDTVVVGDSSFAQARATDGSGRVIQGLSFNWATANSAVLDLAAVTPPAAGTPATDASSGRTATFIGRRTGQSAVTLVLPDPRFVVANATRTETVVVGGVRILSTHDSTLTAVNDTGFAIGAGLVRASGALVTRASQGIRWTHKGLHATVVGTGDTIRYIAASNGVDTLIASHDFCLAGAKCADTAIVRVAQQLALTFTPKTFLAWSFSDTLGPTTITLADRRGNGLAGTSVRFVPATAADSAIVRVSAPFGNANPATGLVPAPRLISQGNGTARVAVLGIGPDGSSVVATDSITETVRQVARRIAVEPLRAVLTANDSIPIRPLARDARGAAIADAIVTTTPVGIAINGIWAGPTSGIIAQTQVSITPSLTSGPAVPQNNPLAPQIPFFVDPAIYQLLRADTAIAGATIRSVSSLVYDSTGGPAVGRFVRFGTSFGVAPDPVQIDASGQAITTWTPPDLAGNYTLSGTFGTTVLNTLADSSGRIVIRRTVTVVADVPDPLTSFVSMTATTMPATTGTATVTITARDRFNNPVKNAKPADFVITSDSPGGGTFSAVSCVLDLCTTTYTAPGAAGTDHVTVKTAATNIGFSPITLTITP